MRTKIGFMQIASGLTLQAKGITKIRNIRFNHDNGSEKVGSQTFITKSKLNE